MQQFTSLGQVDYLYTTAPAQQLHMNYVIKQHTTLNNQSRMLGTIQTTKLLISTTVCKKAQLEDQMCICHSKTLVNALVGDVAV